ncbi:MAG: ABC transporter permease [Clostridiales bacterium]|nr:ABC transporter permease [Clostridiales bacterium]
MIEKTRREQVKTGNLGEGRISNLTFINMVMIGVLAALFIAASLIVPNFFNINTVSNLIAQQAEIIIIGIGIAFLLIAGYFDMSVGGIIAMAAVLCAYFSQADRGIEGLSSGLGMNYWLAAVLTILICSIIGLINAFLVVRMKIASVIATLATMALARGVALIVAKGAQRNAGLPPEFKQIGQHTFFATINVAVLIMVVLVIAALIIERKTVFGRRIFLIGANSEAARLSGIKVSREVSLLYITSSVLAAITGIVMASKFNAGNAAFGTGYEFDALVVTVLGGTSIFGGFGSITCVVVGAFILGILKTSVNMLGFQPDLQLVVSGVVIIIAILAQRYAINKRSS